MSVEGARHPPVLSALFGMKAEDTELLGTVEFIRGTDDLTAGAMSEEPPAIYIKLTTKVRLSVILDEEY